jgi:hypothetical protein
VSADNYVYVRKWRGKYVIEMRFASSDYNDRRKPERGAVEFDTAAQAVAHAHASDDTEYGVRMTSEVLVAMLDETAVKREQA